MLLYTALIGYLWQEALEEDRNFATLIDMIGSMQTREDNEDFRNPIDLMLEDFARRNGLPNPTHFTDDGISGTRFAGVR